MRQTLRPYQEAAVAGVHSEWEKCPATLGVAATGAGKTTIIAEILRRASDKRALILCHRTELVVQMANRLRQFGIETEIEQADQVAATSLWHRAPAVVATPQTLFSGRNGKTRMQRFNPSDFQMLIIDEAHHYVSEKFRSVVEYFQLHPELKVLGVTATPDRSDALALGRIFKSVAFDVEICDMIDEGYLVPIKQQLVKIESLDFSHVRTTAGDLNGADLARIMEQEKNLHGVATAAIEIGGDRRMLVFTASVHQAETLCGIFNRHRHDKADWIFAGTPKELRKESLDKFADGRTQIMVNCGILTEGYDNPAIEVIVSARPTKSRCLYSQIIGRGTRSLPGVIDGLDTADERKAAIAASGKPELVVLDFVGNAGRHQLVTTADILGGRISEEAKSLAIKRIKEKGEAVNIRDEMRQAEIDILRQIEEQKKRDAERKSHLVAKATYRATYIDPFDSFARKAERWQGWKQTRPFTDKQRGIIEKAGHDPDRVSLDEGAGIIAKYFQPSEAQQKVLRRAGYSGEEIGKLKKWEAGKIITELSKTGWKRPQVPAMATREPGEDG